jgi:hypothetical protein
VTIRLALGRGASRPNRAPLLETLAAINRTSLCGLERNGGLLATLRADRPGFNPLGNTRTRLDTLSAIALACFTSLGFVFETLIDKKHLFAGGENELGTAFGAFQNLVMVFHTLLRDRARRGQEAVESRASRRSRCHEVRDITAPDDAKVTEEKTSERIA